MEKSNIRCI